jgi:hypothetical protein
VTTLAAGAVWVTLALCGLASHWLSYLAALLVAWTPLAMRGLDDAAETKPHRISGKGVECERRDPRHIHMRFDNISDTIESGAAISVRIVGHDQSERTELFRFALVSSSSKSLCANECPHRIGLGGQEKIPAIQERKRSGIKPTGSRSGTLTRQASERNRLPANLRRLRPETEAGHL